MGLTEEKVSRFCIINRSRRNDVLSGIELAGQAEIVEQRVSIPPSVGFGIALLAEALLGERRRAKYSVGEEPEA